MSANCKYSHTIEQEEGLPIVHCSIKRCNGKTFLEMKEVYEQLHNGQIMSFNDNCEYAYHMDGQKDCPYYEQQSINYKL